MNSLSSSFTLNPFKSILSLPPHHHHISTLLPITCIEERGIKEQPSQPKPKLTTARSAPKPQPTIKTTRTDHHHHQLKQVQRKTPNPPSLLATIFNAFDIIINNFIDPPIQPSVDPKHVLTGNFAPVDELPPTECTVVEGELPLSLDGAYIRNGPNPQYLPRGPYHLLDGDGMLHSLRISQGHATLCSRYVKTNKYITERDFGSPLLPNFFSGINGPASIARGALVAGRFLTGQFNPINGFGVGNTSLAFFANKLFALSEADLPYGVRVTPECDIETIGRYDFDGKLFFTMTAHPKVDADTGETFGFRYGLIPPFLTFFHFDPNGSKQPDVPIFSMTRPVFIHDFAITKKYAVFAESQISFKPMNIIVRGGSLIGVEPDKVPRIGVIPRYAKDESQMKWFDVPGFNILHAINAWDDDEDSIVLIAPNLISVEHTLERMELFHASVEKVRINLKTGIVLRCPASIRNLDFAVINPAFTGKKNRYIYAENFEPVLKVSGVVKLDVSKEPVLKVSGVVKLDVSKEDHQECTVASRRFGPGCYGGEPFFIAKDPKNLNSSDEDDGFIITFVHDENTGESQFLVMDAKSPTLDIVAVVKLPQRVPYGLHGIFVRDSDLKKL